MATAVLLLIQVLPPPPRLVVEPAQTLSVPLIAGGAGFTVIIFIAVQPVGSRYVIVAVPGATPPIRPVLTPVVVAVAINVLLLLHVPPPVVSVKVIAWPWHTLLLPIMGDNELMIIVLATLQPSPTV